MIGIILLLILNFAISWFNSISVGRMWSESKVIGGQIRLLAIAGYIMAVAGFTMVYGYVMLLIAPYIIQLIPDLSDFPVNNLVTLAGDMMYILIATAIIPTGIIIWFNSVVSFWKRKTLANGAVAGWNTYAQVRNIMNATKNMPSAIGRIAETLFGGKRKKDKSVLIFVAVFIIILAICGGYLTATHIIRKADIKYDGLAEFKQT